MKFEIGQRVRIDDEALVGACKKGCIEAIEDWYGHAIYIVKYDSMVRYKTRYGTFESAERGRYREKQLAALTTPLYARMKMKA